jgi:methyl-accepting chemotaxis protein
MINKKYKRNTHIKITQILFFNFKGGAMNVKSKRNFSNFFLNKNFQGKMILAALLAGAIGFLFILSLLMFFPSGFSQHHHLNNFTIQSSFLPLKTVILSNWIPLLLGGAILVILVMIATHRIAGPLYRFEHAVKKMSKGNLTDTIILRKNDEGKILAEHINTLSQTLSKDLKEIHKNSSFIKDLTVQFETTNSVKNPEEIKAICHAIQKKNDCIIETLESYTLKNN